MELTQIRKSKKFIRAFFFAILLQTAQAQFEPNYDEGNVPEFNVPDPLTTFNGEKITGATEWKEKRRPELHAFFEQQVYGQVPGELDDVSFQLLENKNDALNGKAIRKQVEVTLSKNDRSLSFNLLIYLPKGKNRVPLFLGYNFYGNHTVTEDPKVLISKAWTMNREEFGITDNTPTEKSRGVRVNRWSIERILEAGFGLATIYYGEVDPDKNDLSDGLHRLFYDQNQQNPQSNEWGSIAAWAFGLSKALDYFETDNDVDADKIIAFGHSRLGKVSLWAAANDERFAGAIGNNSGCGGAALSKRKFGETVGRINSSFPHWFCENFNQYNGYEEKLPVDQHELLALIAPRPVYIASAEEDQWADPKGEFLSTYYATPVYELFGKKGIPTSEMPEIHKPIQHVVS
ncbi:MAG: acetylxylan esterase, partial [Pricia sp.]|nr:acetylxylan esterase [Pricia sp.]